MTPLLREFKIGAGYDGDTYIADTTDHVPKVLGDISYIRVYPGQIHIEDDNGNTIIALDIASPTVYDDSGGEI